MCTSERADDESAGKSRKSAEDLPFPLVQDCRGYEAMKKVAVVTHKYKVDLMESPSHEQSLIT